LGVVGVGGVAEGEERVCGCAARRREVDHVMVGVCGLARDVLLVVADRGGLEGMSIAV
jgi:hypothetical protein